MFDAFMPVFCVLTMEILEGVIPCVTNEGVRVRTKNLSVRWYMNKGPIQVSGLVSIFQHVVFRFFFFPRGIISPVSAVCDCLLNILAATTHIWRSCATESPCRGDRDPLIICSEYQSSDSHAPPATTWRVISESDESMCSGGPQYYWECTFGLHHQQSASYREALDGISTEDAPRPSCCSCTVEAPGIMHSGTCYGFTFLAQFCVHKVSDERASSRKSRMLPPSRLTDRKCAN